MTRLPGCLHDNKDRLLLALEIKGAAAISEIGVMGNIIVRAVVTTCGLVAWFCIHRWRYLADVACGKYCCVYEYRSNIFNRSRHITMALRTQIDQQQVACFDRPGKIGNRDFMVAFSRQILFQFQIETPLIFTHNRSA